MPIFSTAKLPIPKSWDEFEDVVSDVYRFIWEDRQIVRNGRSGQPQHGVDIYGKPVFLKGEYAGIQCKDKQITSKEIVEEIKKSEKFKPTLREFVFAVAAFRDVKIQEQIRVIDERRSKSGKSSIRIAFWDDISLNLASSRELMEKHFPQFVERKASYAKILDSIGSSKPRDWVFNSIPKEMGFHSVFAYKNDALLTIVRDDNEEQDREFREDWATQFPDKDARFCIFRIYYAASLLEEVFMVALDGYRAFVPLPKIRKNRGTHLEITRFQDSFARIVNFHTNSRYDEYLSLAKIAVV
jgi:hypothetical protein